MVARLQRSLLAWYARARRDLPWRRTRDPYAIWLSEVMLQQTRVETVIPYYERFLAAYPTVEALADAPLDDVLARWSGLGYYRRARALHAGAAHVRDACGGAFPSTPEELLRVPGIGKYTAGAVASIAFQARAPLVDGNVARVLARLFAIDDDVRGARGQAALWRIANELVPERAPGDWNQALMELGATTCAPRAPRCLVCPVRADCCAHREGLTGDLPRLAPRAAPRGWARVALVAERTSPKGGKVLLARRAGAGLFGGMWEPPMVDAADDRAGELAALGRLVGARITKAGDAGSVTHVLSHRRMTIACLRIPMPRAPRLGPSAEYDALEAVALGDLEGRGVSALARKVLAAAGAAPLPE